MVRSREVAMLAKRALEAITPEIRDIAAESGINYGTLRSWRAGVRSPGPDNLLKIADMADRRADILRGLAAELRAGGGDRDS